MQQMLGACYSVQTRFSLEPVVRLQRGLQYHLRKAKAQALAAS